MVATWVSTRARLTAISGVGHSFCMNASAFVSHSKARLYFPWITTLAVTVIMSATIAYPASSIRMSAECGMGPLFISCAIASPANTARTNSAFASPIRATELPCCRSFWVSARQLKEVRIRRMLVTASASALPTNITHATTSAISGEFKAHILSVEKDA